jgi:transposase
VSRKPFWLRDPEWSGIEPHLPADVRGKARVDDRRVISGIVHVLKSGCRWCDCPPEYGPPTTVYNRFVRWAERGVWENLFLALAGKGRSMDMQMVDSTHIKAHRSAAGGKGGAKAGDWPWSVSSLLSNSVLMVVRDSEKSISRKMFAALLGVSASANLPRR